MAADKWGEITPLREVCLPTAALAIDKDRGIIRGVRILGRISLNKREYTPEAVRKGRDLYEGRPVNLDHHEASGRDGQRSVASRFGWLQNVHEANDGLEGDLHYLRAHPLAAQVIETAERNPRMFGLSHNADGRTSRRNGKIFVEEIIGVRSVDLVADPATTKSLFESLESNMDMNTDPNAAAAAAPTGNVTDMIIGKVREILTGDGDGPTKATAVSKIVKVMLKVEDQIDAAMSGDAAKKPDGDPSAAPTKESKDMDALNAILKETRDRLQAIESRNSLLESQNAARTMLVEAKVEVTDARIGAIVKAATPEEKKALVESWPVQTLTEAVKPRSAGKPISEGWTPPKDSKETAKRLKSSLRR